MAKDYYDILGVSRSASDEEIKRAYRKLAHQHHPDKSGGDEAKFKEVNAAYQVLGNKDKRTKYDQFGPGFDQAGPGPGAAGFNWSDFSQAGGFGSQAGGFESADFGDIFGDLFGFGNSRSTRSRSERGADLEYGFTITLAEAAFGADKVIAIERERPCPTCSGSGAEPGSKPVTCTTCQGAGQVEQIRNTMFGAMRAVGRCPNCNGTGQVITKPCRACHGDGRVASEQKLKVTIPAGIDDGQSIRLSGEGQAGRRGTPSGDLYLRISVEPDTRFKRTKNDLSTYVNVSVSAAALGTKVPIATLDGDVLLAIPAGTQPGTVIKLKGKGIPHLRGRGRGDLFVTVNVKIPTKLNKKARAAFEALEAMKD